MLHFDCDECGKPLQVDDSLAGRQIKCRHCHATQEVPEPEPEPKRVIAVPASPIEKAKSRGCFLIGLDVARILVWIVLFFDVTYILNTSYPAVLRTATSAPQQAFMAGDACVWLIGSYLLARAIDKGLAILQHGMGG